MKKEYGQTESFFITVMYMKYTSMKVQGEVQYVDLEGGYYTLKTTQGDVYKLEGGPNDLYKSHSKVEVEGEVEKNGFGIGFGTPILRVKKVYSL